MITLTITVDNISTVMQVYNQIQLQRAAAEEGTYTTVSGLGPVSLVAGITSYSVIDTTGLSTSWYKSRYYSTSTGSYSGWSEPVLGSPGDLFYNPLYSDEISYGTSEQLVIDRIRKLIGDPLGLRREYGEEASSSIHPDGKTYELDEKGWPVSVTMNGVSMNDSSDPTINGYRYLRFDEDISTTTWSGGVEYGVDIWYYTFRHSDREIMEAYDTCPPPPGLTTTNATSEAYMLQTAIELLYQELWEDSTEDGAKIDDEGSKYDPSPGLESKRKLLDGLQRRLDKLTASLKLLGISGVRVD
jgi:hypothetical protein